MVIGLLCTAHLITKLNVPIAISCHLNADMSLYLEKIDLPNGNVLLKSNNSIVLLNLVNHMRLQSLDHSIILQTIRDTTDTNSNIVEIELCADATNMTPAEVCRFLSGDY